LVFATRNRALQLRYFVRLYVKERVLKNCAGLPADLPEAIRLLRGIGYVREGDLGVAGRDAFRSPPGTPPQHLYVLEQGANELRRHLAFLDALSADDPFRAEYATLKRSLAAAYKDNRSAYTEAKSAFIHSAIESH